MLKTPLNGYNPQVNTEQPATPTEAKQSEKRKGGGAAFVALGILFSRLSGFLRETLFAYAFGNSAAADAFKGALRIPNLLQNLLGEGVLSASFIPVYAKLRGAGREEEARRLAGSVLGLLSLVSLLISALGVFFAPSLIELITPGFEGERRELAITLVQIFFPGTALLVLSAWCLGILNSHGRFFLPYVAPVFWNGAIIGALLIYRGKLVGDPLAIAVAYGVLLGSLLQLAVQVPTVWGLLRGSALSLQWRDENTRAVLKNFVPVVTGRGVVQISAFVDSIIASLLAVGSVSALAYAQMIYLLPVSLFGMSISAAELPQMSTVVGGAEIGDRPRLILERLHRATRQLLFFIVPSAVFLIFFGDLVVSALYEYGEFTADDTLRVSFILSALSIALPVSTLSRLYASALYALGEPKIPLRGALVRVGVGTAVGAFLALQYFPEYSIAPGVVGLAFGSTIGAVAEWSYLRTESRSRIGKLPFEGGFLFTIIGGALFGTLGAVLALGGGRLHTGVLPLLSAGTLYGLGYLAVCVGLRIEEVRKIPVIGRVLSRGKR